MPLESDAKQYEAEFAAFQKEMAAFLGGNKSAAARARKALGNGAKLAKELRKEIMEKKNKM